MSPATWAVYSPFAKEHFGKGLAEGPAEGEARAILVVLTARGLGCSQEEHDRITSCTDPDLLPAWAKRAATLQKVAEIFD